MPASTTGINPTVRWRRRKTARPAEILDAALAAFAERGFAATRLDDVAVRAGITKGVSSRRESANFWFLAAERAFRNNRQRSAIGDYSGINDVPAATGGRIK